MPANYCAPPQPPPANINHREIATLPHRRPTGNDKQQRSRTPTPWQERWDHLAFGRPATAESQPVQVMLDADPTFDRDPHSQVTRNPRCTTPTPTIVGTSGIRPKWLADRFREACIRCDVAQPLIVLRLLDLCPDELMHGVD